MMQSDRQARWFARAKADPAFLARRAARERARRLAIKSDPARAAGDLAKAMQRQRDRRGTVQRAAPFAGSVLAASADSAGQRLLATLTALAPRHDDRDEVIAEAALLVLQGAAPSFAVKAAVQKVSREFRPTRNAVNIDDCRWL